MIRTGWSGQLLPCAATRAPSATVAAVPPIKVRRVIVRRWPIMTGPHRERCEWRKVSAVAAGRKGLGQGNADVLDQAEDLRAEDLPAMPCGHSTTLAEAPSIRANPTISAGVGCSPSSSIEEITPMT